MQEWPRKREHSQSHHTPGQQSPLGHSQPVDAVSLSITEVRPGCLGHEEWDSGPRVRDNKNTEERKIALKTEKLRGLAEGVLIRTKKISRLIFFFVYETVVD